MFELTHDLYFFELAWREVEEVDSLDLFDCDESSGLVVVASVNCAERASAQADETIVDEALGDLSVACEIELLLLLLLHDIKLLLLILAGDHEISQEG